MTAAIRELIKYRELLFMITWRDINIKYKQSIMGFMWAILMPMLIVLTGTIVRFGMSKLSGTPLDLDQIITVSVKAIPWAFFISSINFSTNCLLNNVNLVTKIYFPKEIFPLSAVLSQLFDFVIASAALVVFLIVVNTGVSVHLIWVPILMLVLIFLAVALGLFLSAADLFFRDVKYIVNVITNFAIFFTPVFYDSRLAGKWESLILLNPVAPILEGLNSCIVLHQEPRIYWVLYSAFVAILGVYLSMLVFKKLEARFAEYI